MTTDTFVKGVYDSRSSKAHTSSEEVAEIQEWLAVGLAMIAGFVDAYGIITYRTYLSFMSGNTTQAGFRIGQGNFWAAMHSALAIVFFVGGSFAGALLAHSAVRRIRRLVFGVVAGSLALIIGFTQLGFSSGWGPIAVLSFAMGAMNTALSRVGAQYVSLTFVTGTLSRIGVQLALAVRHAPLPGQPGIVGYAPIPDPPDGRYLGRVPDRRIDVGGGDTALWGVGIVVPRAGSVGAGGVRPQCHRGSLISTRAAIRPEKCLNTLLLTSGEQSSQLAALDLAHSISGYRGSYANQLGHLEICQARPAVGLEFLRSCGTS